MTRGQMGRGNTRRHEDGWEVVEEVLRVGLVGIGSIPNSER